MLFLPTVEAVMFSVNIYTAYKQVKLQLDLF